MATAIPRRSVPWLLQAPEVPDVHAPRWFHRLPGWLTTGTILFVLLAISAVVRTRYISGQFWGDEATSVGIASHPLTAIPGILRQEGSAPLYYLILHVWISVLGSGEAATRALSLLLGLASIPLSMWAGWSLFGRRAGMAAAVLFAFSAFLTQYAQETQPYELLAVLGLIATTSFLQALVRGRRRHLIVLAVALALILYTSFWGIFFWIGTAAALGWLSRSGLERRRLLADGGLAFGVAAVLFVPWVPSLIYQVGHATSPWGYGDHPGFGFPSSILGTDRVSVSLGVAFVVGLLPVLIRRRHRTPEALMIWILIILAVVSVLLARVFSVVSPVWETRYLATVVAALLLLGGLACARSGVVGVVVLVLTLAFVANPASFAPQHKSDMRDVAGELAPYLQPGDLVVAGAPEQSPLAWYYLPGGLRFATTMGPVADPSFINWTNAYTRLRDADPRRTLNALVAGLHPGQRLLFTRPLTEGVAAWTQSWSRLVRRRAAQWGALIATDPELKAISAAVAPHNYRSACCVADSAVVYTKLGPKNGSSLPSAPRAP